MKRITNRKRATEQAQPHRPPLSKIPVHAGRGPVAGRAEATRARLFRRGLCGALALALHERTGWPLVLVVGLYPDEEGETGEMWALAAHAACRSPSGMLADVDGLRPVRDVYRRLAFDEEPLGTEVRNATWREVEDAFTMGGFDDAELEAARRHVAENEEQWALGERAQPGEASPTRANESFTDPHPTP